MYFIYLFTKEIKQYQEKWLKYVHRMDTNRLPKQALQYKPIGRRKDDRGRDGGTNFILRIKEQETRLTLQEHDDDDDDDLFIYMMFIFLSSLGSNSDSSYLVVLNNRLFSR